MDPDDKFSPPLDGLSRGHKLHQVLTTLSSSDIIHDTQYLDKSKGGPQIIGVLIVSDVIDSSSEQGRFGLLYCNWWHMKFEPDWWEYLYGEIPPDAEVESLENGDEESGVVIQIDYSCGWFQQENEVVDGLTYFGETEEDEWRYEPFSPKFEAPKPLTRSILDSYLPKNINRRHRASD